MGRREVYAAVSEEYYNMISKTAFNSALSQSKVIEYLLTKGIILQRDVMLRTPENANDVAVLNNAKEKDIPIIDVTNENDLFIYRVALPVEANEVLKVLAKANNLSVTQYIAMWTLYDINLFDDGANHDLTNPKRAREDGITEKEVAIAMNSLTKLHEKAERRGECLSDLCCLSDFAILT